MIGLAALLLLAPQAPAPASAAPPGPLFGAVPTGTATPGPLPLSLSDAIDRALRTLRRSGTQKPPPRLRASLRPLPVSRIS